MSLISHYVSDISSWRSFVLSHTARGQLLSLFFSDLCSDPNLSWFQKHRLDTHAVVRLVRRSPSEVSVAHVNRLALLLRSADPLSFIAAIFSNLSFERLWSRITVVDFLNTHSRVYSESIGNAYLTLPSALSKRLSGVYRRHVFADYWSSSSSSSGSSSPSSSLSTVSIDSLEDYDDNPVLLDSDSSSSSGDEVCDFLSLALTSLLLSDHGGNAVPSDVSVRSIEHGDIATMPPSDDFNEVFASSSSSFYSSPFYKNHSWFDVNTFSSDFSTYASRLASFPLSYNMHFTAAAAAAAGFVHMRCGDLLRCFHCSLTLCQFEPSDCVFSEHLRWNYDCQYITLVEKMCAGRYTTLVDCYSTVSDVVLSLLPNPSAPPLDTVDSGWDDQREARDRDYERKIAERIRAQDMIERDNARAHERAQAARERERERAQALRDRQREKDAADRERLRDLDREKCSLARQKM